MTKYIVVWVGIRTNSVAGTSVLIANTKKFVKDYIKRNVAYSAYTGRALKVPTMLLHNPTLFNSYYKGRIAESTTLHYSLYNIIYDLAKNSQNGHFTGYLNDFD